MYLAKETKENIVGIGEVGIGAVSPSWYLANVDQNLTNSRDTMTYIDELLRNTINKPSQIGSRGVAAFCGATGQVVGKSYIRGIGDVKVKMPEPDVYFRISDNSGMGSAARKNSEEYTNEIIKKFVVEPKELQEEGIKYFDKAGLNALNRFTTFFEKFISMPSEEYKALPYGGLPSLLELQKRINSFLLGEDGETGAEASKAESKES